MGKGKPVTPMNRADVIREWRNGACTYVQVSMITGIPLSTVRLIIDDHLKEKMKPLKQKLAEGVQLNLSL